MMKRFEDATPPPEDAALADARRRRVVGRLHSVIRAEAIARDARRSRARFVWALAAAAAVLLAVGVSWRVFGSRTGASASVGRLATATGAVILTHDGRGETTREGAALQVGDQVATLPDARARVVLESGATVELAMETLVRVEPTARKNERVAISAGEISVHVPKLGKNESFGVKTPDSEIVVRGTSFVVSVKRGESHVRVSEGTVSVKHGDMEAILYAGNEWPIPPPLLS